VAHFLAHPVVLVIVAAAILGAFLFLVPFEN